MKEISFYRANEKPYGAFSNLYRRTIVFEGGEYPTSEHAYQAGKHPPHSKRTRAAKRDLRTAYLMTDFEFEAEGRRYTLRIGDQNPEVRDLLARHGVQNAAYITAHNPASLPRGEAHNTLAMRALRRDLEAGVGGSWAVFEGAGQGRAGGWPPEPSLMVLGIDRTQAEKLGRRYGQYAIVWVDATGMPSLVELVDLDHAKETAAGMSELVTEAFAVDECKDPAQHAVSTVEPVPVGSDRRQGDLLLDGAHLQEVRPTHRQ